MRFTGFYSSIAALLTALALTACSTVLLPPNEPVTVPLVASTEQADAALAEVRRERASIDARYAGAEQVCYARFFVNTCLDKAKEERRSKQAYLNAVENDAQYFKRKASVDERDRQVAQAEKEFAADEARRAAEPTPAPRLPTKPVPPAKGKLAGRQAQHDARAKQQAAEDQVKAAEVSGNVAAFAKKQTDAADRQRKVAEKLAQKAAKKAAAKPAETVPAAPAAPTN